ncbi:MAG: threonine/serine exporter family protein [Bacteroidota bacterium]|nr:threonine/serine exporter family protein [Bacteroidota bacterium]
MKESDSKTCVLSAVKAAIMIIEKGGTTSMADKTFRSIISKCDVSDVSIMWRLDNLIVGYSVEGRTHTILLPVGGIGTELTGVSKVFELAENVAKGKVDILDVDSELDRITKLPPIHSTWIIILTAGLAAAFYALFHHESIGSTAIVFIAAVTGQVLRMNLKAKKVKDAQITLICGLLSAGITSIALHLGFGQLEIQTLIASVVYLVPGLLMINAFVDLTEQKFIFIGTQKIINASFIFIILALVILTAYTFIKI